MKIIPTDFSTLDDILYKNKPDLARSTRNTYASILRSLHKRIYGLDGKFSDKSFADEKMILEEIGAEEPRKRKTMLSAIIAFNGTEHPVTILRKVLMDDSDEVRKDDDKQLKSLKQKENWLTMDDVKKVFDYKYNTVKPLTKMKELSATDFFKWTEMIILALTTGLFFPPRRSTDWCEMKIRGFDKDADNYIDIKNKQFVFNVFKTSKFYHTQRVDVPKKLWDLLKQYIAANDHEYLLVNKSGEKITPPRLTQILNKLFGKSISTSMLRHIYLTDKLGSIPRLNELKELAKQMGHSIEEQQQYILHNDDVEADTEEDD